MQYLKDVIGYSHTINLDNTYTHEINNYQSISRGIQFKFDQNIDRVEVYKKITTSDLSLSSPCLWVALQHLTIHTYNYTTFDPGQLFPQNTWQVQIWPQHRYEWGLSKQFHNPLFIRPPCPWVALPNLTIHTIAQSLTLVNFFHKTHGKFKFSHNIARVKVYQNNFTTPNFAPDPIHFHFHSKDSAVV